MEGLQRSLSQSHYIRIEIFSRLLIKMNENRLNRTILELKYRTTKRRLPTQKVSIALY